MQIFVDGHLYALQNFEDPNDVQPIQFIRKVPKDDNPSELVTISDGTTNEELLKVLINRTQFLNSKFPCRENSIAITKMEEALMWFDRRTNDRKERGVEGKHEK